MKKKRLLLLIVPILIVRIFGQQFVKTGGPPASAAEKSAAVKGVVKFEGAPPKATPINMAADPTCVKQHLTPVLNQDVLTGANGGLRNVIVFVADGLSQQTFEPPSQPVVLNQKGCMYQPHVLAIQANQKLEVVNDDPTSHNIHPVPANNREWNKSEPPGSKAEETFP